MIAAIVESPARRSGDEPSTPDMVGSGLSVADAPASTVSPGLQRSLESEVRTPPCRAIALTPAGGSQLGGDRIGQGVQGVDGCGPVIVIRGASSERTNALRP